MSKNIFDKKTYNRLKTDVIHIQNDLMTEAERTRKLAHVTDYVSQFVPKIASYQSEEDIIFHLNELFGLNKNQHIDLTSKEASRIVNDLINIKYAKDLNKYQKEYYVEKISYVLKYAAKTWQNYYSPRILNALIEFEQMKNDEKSSEVEKLLKEVEDKMVSAPTSEIERFKQEFNRIKKKISTQPQQPAAQQQQQPAAQPTSIQPQQPAAQQQQQPAAQPTSTQPQQQQQPAAQQSPAQHATLLDAIDGGHVPSEDILKNTVIQKNEVIDGNTRISQDKLAQHIARSIRGPGKGSVEGFLQSAKLMKCLGTYGRIGMMLKMAFREDKTKFFPIFEKVYGSTGVFNEKGSLNILKNFLNDELFSHGSSLSAWRYVKSKVDQESHHTASILISLLQSAYTDDYDKNLWNNLSDHFSKALQTHEQDDIGEIAAEPVVDAGSTNKRRNRGPNPVDKAIGYLQNLDPGDRQKVIDALTRSTTT